MNSSFFCFHELNKLENILKSKCRSDLFQHFKSLLNFILDEPLKFYLVSLFASLAMNESKELLQIKINDTSNYLKAKLSIDPHKKTSDHYLDIYSTLEANYLMLYFMCRGLNLKSEEINLNLPENNNSESYFFYTNKTDEETIIHDLYSILNIHDYFEKYSGSFISYVSEFNSSIRAKDYFSTFAQLDMEVSKSTSCKIVISNIEYLLDIVFISLKYIYWPSNNVLDTELNINIGKFSLIIKNFFTVVFEYLLINYSSYDKIIKDKISNMAYFENYLTLCRIITSVVSEIKFFSDKADSIVINQIDFNTYYPSFTESFVEHFFTILKYKIISKLNDLVQVYENINNFTLQNFQIFYFPPYLLNLAKEGTSDFLVSHATAIFINENNFEVENKSNWLKFIIQFFCFADITDKVYFVIINHLQRKENNNILQNNNNIYEDCESEVLKEEISKIVRNFMFKFKIIIPRRLMVLKEMYCLTYLVIMNYLLIKLPVIKDNLSTDEFVIASLEEFKHFQNKFTFILCSNILKLLQKENYRHVLRVYGYYTFPLDYYELSEVINEQKESKSSQSQISCQNSVVQNYFPIYSQQSGQNSILPFKENDVYVDMTIEEMVTYINDENKNNIDTTRIKSASNIGMDFKHVISHSQNQNQSAPYNNINNSQSNFKGKKKNIQATKFDVTCLMKNLDISQFKNLENRTGKKLVLTNNKNGAFYLKMKIKNTPASIVLTQKDNGIEFYDDISYFTISNYNNLTTQSFIFIKEFLSCDLTSKIDMDSLIGMEINLQGLNLCQFNENINNSIVNLTNTFAYYDIKEQMSYEDVVENMIKLLE